MSDSRYEGFAKGAIEAGGTARVAVTVAGETNVSTPNGEYARLLKLWKLPRLLMQGTRGMRAVASGTAYSQWLPKEPNEDAQSYKARVHRSVLFNGFRKTVRDMTGKVFRVPIVLGDDMHESLKECAENIDNAGRHLNVFARDVFFDGMQTGVNFILVEMPAAMQNPDGSPVTVAQEQAAKRRPYLCHIKAEDLIGFKAAPVEGVMTLKQVRIREHATVPDGEFGETCIEQIRVLDPGRWRIYRIEKDANGKETWVLHEEGATSLGYIPIVPVYIHRTGFMIGEPPLEDLADLNVAHWQSSSDQRNILHVARVPILFGAGLQADMELSIGANTMVKANDPGAKLEWVEHTGAAISAGQADLDKLEFQMQVQGLQLTMPIKGGQTATGELRDEAKENSPLAMMATALQDALECAFEMMAEYAGLGKDAGGSLIVNTDFGSGSGDIAEIQYLTQAMLAGKIDLETYLNELKRRGVLADHVDIEAIMSRLSNAPPDDAQARKMDLSGANNDATNKAGTSGDSNAAGNSAE